MFWNKKKNKTETIQEETITSPKTEVKVEVFNNQNDFLTRGTAYCDGPIEEGMSVVISNDTHTDL